MTRGFWLLCLSVVSVFLVGTGVANAAPKTLAVLGLEVKGNNVTQQATDAAGELTKELRTRASNPTSTQFTPATGAQKELFDQKLLFCNGGTETPACMTKIAGDIHAEVILYGHFELEGSAAVINLWLFDATTKTNLQTIKNRRVDIGEFKSNTPGIAKKLYSDLTGESSMVQLTLKISNSDSGTVSVNDKPAQPYTSGQITVSVPEGKAHIYVKPNEGGFEPYDEHIQVGAQDTSRDIKLAPKPGTTTNNGNNGNNAGSNEGSGAEAGSGSGEPCNTPGCQEQHHEYGGTVSGDRPGGAWRKTFVVGAVGTVAAGAVLGYGIVKSYGLGGGPFTFGTSCTAIPNTNPQKFMGPNDCSSGNDYVHLTEGAWVGVAVLGTLTVIALYEGYIKHDSANTSATEHVENGHHKRRDRFVVTPVIGPNGGGATVQLNW
jgi:hypothetical protein